MTAALIDGKIVAAALRARVKDAVRDLAGRRGVVTGLAAVLVGNDPASEVYIGTKKKMAAETGIHAVDYRLPATTGQAELIALIDQLNRDASVHGILIQLPLPAQIDPHVVIAAIDPDKDVDGFIRSMSGAWRWACRRSRRARPWAACGWRSPSIPRWPASRRW